MLGKSLLCVQALFWRGSAGNKADRVLSTYGVCIAKKKMQNLNNNETRKIISDSAIQKNIKVMQ